MFCASVHLWAWRAMVLTDYESDLANRGDLEGLAHALEVERNYGREIAQLRNEHGDTLLHLSLFYDDGRHDRSDIIRLLARYGADVNATNRSPVTPLHLCAFPDETEVLIDLGARVEAIDSLGWTPLFYAITESSKISCARVLMRRGANLDVVDCDGDDAHHFAVAAENWEFAQLFAAVKQAGSWRNYSNAHRIALVHLRTLCERGRARPPTSRREPVLARLFAAAPPLSSTKKAARLASRAPKRPLPNEIFRLILAFWRTDRDD